MAPKYISMAKYLFIEVIMNNIRIIIAMLLLSVSCILIADPAQDAWVTALGEEFPENCAPLAQWEYSGSHAVIDPMFTVNVTSIPDSMTCESEGMTVPIPDAQASEGFDNSYTINKLVDWLANYICPQGIHAQIYIPEGVYHFNDQIVMKSNISLKGAGSDLTRLYHFKYVRACSAIT
jgi:hypothetical protein